MIEQRRSRTQVAPTNVALFVTCVGDLVAPGAPRAAVEVLEAMGVRVEVPRAQTCCGQPALNSGYPQEARILARRWLRTFAPYDAVVSVSGSCTATVQHAYLRLLEGTERQQVQDLAAKSWEFTQFVAEFGHDLTLRLDATVTYHDSCHMLRTLHERESPRKLLGRIEGLTLVEMSDSEVCCGFGGTFATKMPEDGRPDPVRGGHVDIPGRHPHRASVQTVGGQARCVTSGTAPSEWRARH